ncbi:MAG: RDD family protein [Gemmatimonadaceae bacterium]
MLRVFGIPKHNEDPKQIWGALFLSLGLLLIIQAIPEGLRGATLGKWLVGIRVRKIDGTLPGFARAAGRVGVFWIADLATVIARGLLTTPNEKATVPIILDVLFRGLLLVTVRRGQGLVLLQDYVTGTRVVRPVGSIAQRRSEAHRVDAPTLTGNEPRMGPYIVLAPISAGSAVTRGWDATLLRNVWIVPCALGTPEVSQERRDLARLTRLRWVAGSRSSSENWDAFEAPLGEPLASRLTRAVAWDTQQEWILDLTSEYATAALDGTTSDVDDVDAIWITPTNRVVLPEGTGPNRATVEPNDAHSAAFIASFVSRVEENNRGKQQLPRHAARVIAAVKRATSISEIARTVKETLGRPTSISQLRRFGLMAATLVPLAGCPLVGSIGTDQQAARDPLGFKMQGLAEFIADSTKSDSGRITSTVADSANKENTSWAFNKIGAKLGRIARLLHAPALFPSEYQPPRQVRKREEQLVDVYLATAFGARPAQPTRCCFEWSPL